MHSLREAVEPYRYYQAQANPSPDARAVREARPYERNGGRLTTARRAISPGEAGFHLRSRFHMAQAIFHFILGVEL